MSQKVEVGRGGAAPKPSGVHNLLRNVDGSNCFLGDRAKVGQGCADQNDVKGCGKRIKDCAVAPISLFGRGLFIVTRRESLHVLLVRSGLWPGR